MSRELIRMEGICKYFPGVKALENVDLVVHEGEVHAMLGENGAGKSTLIKILNGVYKPDAGSIYVKGEKKNSTASTTRRHVALASCFRSLTSVRMSALRKMCLLAASRPTHWEWSIIAKSRGIRRRSLTRSDCIRLSPRISCVA